MSIIVFEGIDGIGKTTIIEKLVKKYPQRFSMFAFPTEGFKEMVGEELNPNLQSNPLSQLIHYHTAFEMDFIRLREDIEFKSRKGVLLLDRYYMSNLVYATANFKKHGYENHPFLQLLENIDRGITPDCVIFLRGFDMDDFPHKDDSHFTADEFNQMQYDYSMTLHRLRDQKKSNALRLYYH